MASLNREKGDRTRPLRPRREDTSGDQPFGGPVSGAGLSPAGNATGAGASGACGCSARPRTGGWIIGAVTQDTQHAIAVIAFFGP